MEFPSVYETTLECLKAEGLVARRLDGRPLEPGAGTTSFTGSAPELLGWCRRGESLVVSQQLRDAWVLAGFERLSRARFAASRYERICAIAREVWIVGMPDASVGFPAHRVVPVQTGPLLREWFLLIDSERFRALLVARDLDGLDMPPSQRRFEGVTTHMPSVIERVRSVLTDALAGG
jgi:DICT domain-containing protein